FSAIADSGAEILEFEVERLGWREVSRNDVASAITELVLAERQRIGQLDARVEDPHRLVARVVVDDHLLCAHDRRPTELAWREPRELDVRDDVRRESKI